MSGDQHKIWAAIAHRVKNMGHLAPEVMPSAAIDLASLVIGWAVSLGVEPETIQGALGFAVERDPADRAAIEAFRALKRVVDNNGGDGPVAGGVDLTIRWGWGEGERYEISGCAGECTFGADAPTLEVALVAVSMADEGEHHSVSADGYLLCRECDGTGRTQCSDTYWGQCEDCIGTGLLGTSALLDWPAGGLKVPEEHDGIPDPLGELRSISEGLREQVLEAQAAKRGEPARFDTVARRMTMCRADDDGYCAGSDCPQLRDGEPAKSGRHCPLDPGEPAP